MYLAESFCYMLETKTTLHAKLFQLYLTQVNYTSIKKKHSKISPVAIK